MSQWLLSLSLLLLVSSCQKSQAQNPEEQVVVEYVTFDEAESEELPPEALTFDAEVKFKNFSPAQEKKVRKAIAIIKKVVGSKEFRDAIYNFTYEGKKQFIDNNGLTNEQIYKKILEAKEKLKPTIDNKMYLELKLYYTLKDTIGYTYPSTSRVWVNKRYFKKFKAHDVAGNLFHEWPHKIGFEHDFKYTPSRESSVPYAIGYMIERMGRKYE